MSWDVALIDITYPISDGVPGYLATLDRVCQQVVNAIQSGNKIAILSDPLVDAERVPISALIAGAGVHHPSPRIQ